MNTPDAESARGGGQDTAFFAAAAVVFGIAVAATVYSCLSMSMPWMRMAGQSWPGVVAGFLGMWIAMMVAMMLPSFTPTLWRYRRALRSAGASHLGRLTILVSVGYFAAWSASGVAAWMAGIALSAMPGRRLIAAVVFVIAGCLQFTAWKTRHLACCRATPGHDRVLPASTGAAWRCGLSYGLHCNYCCAGFTALLVTAGVMDLQTMALVMLAISAERLAPAGERIAKLIGAGAVAAGLLLIVVQGRSVLPMR